MRMQQLLRRLGALLLCLTAFVLPSWAQNNKATVLGTVTDPQGALVRAANVTITNAATGEVRTTATGDDGTYIITNLNPGTYRLQVEGSGFKTLVYENIVLETNARQSVDAVFTELAGAGAATVTVTADSGPVTESETSVRGDIITGREVTELPIPQRNFTILAGLSPGVTRPTTSSVGVLGGNNRVDGGGSNSTESTRFRESGGSVISANGARVTQNNFSLDGVDNNESQFGQIAFFPNPDAIAEFKIETSVPSAESGRAGGAIISATFKSGGNDFHGTAFEEYQGRFASAAASQFDENGPNRNRIPNYVTHNYGGTIGGPIFLPAFNEGGPYVYNGRNKSFFFFSFGGQRNSTPAFGGGEFPFVTVPTARMRNGDFGELLQPGTSQTYTLAGGGTVVAPAGTIFAPNGTAIPGNNLANCPSCGAISTFGRNLLRAYPLPTEAGLVNNYRRNRKEKSQVDSYDIKLDQRISDKNLLFGRYSKYKNSRLRDNNFPTGSSPTGVDLASGFGAGDEFGNTRGVTLSDTHYFSPTVINDARFGYNRVQIGINNPGVNGALGFPANASAALGANNINVCGTCDGTLLFGVVEPNTSLEFVGDGGPFYFLSNNFNFADALTVVKGKSVYKAGVDYRVRQNSNFDGGRNGGIKGNYVYGTSAGGFANGNYNGIGANDTGSAVANTLLGYNVGSITRGSPGGPYLQSSKEIAFFVQDDWKYSSNLTLNLGLRYDIFTAPTERFDRQSNFEPNTRRILVAGENAAGGRDLVDTDKNNFGPRIGFAYSGFREDKRLVLRGGYGLLYSIDISGQQPLTANPGTGAANYSCNPITNPAGCPAGAVGRNPFERGIPIAPEIVSAPGTTFAAPTGGTLYYVDPNRKDAMFHQYNLTAQYEFARNWLAEVGYVGSRSRNLLVVRNIGNASDPGGPGSRQVPNISNVIASQYFGKAYYDALQTKLEKRLSDGLSVLAAYTWSHAIDDSPGGFCIGGTGARNCGPDNPLRFNLDRANSDLDIRHRFTLANVYDLPLGRGRRFGSEMPKVLDFFIGGFQLNNIVTIQSGGVFNPTIDGARPDLIGDPTPTAAQERQLIRLNRAAFRAPVTPVFANDPGGVKFGTLGRNTFRGERQEFWDASLFKNFRVSPISEAFNVQVRFSAYNVLNHVNRGTPNGDLNSGDFGKDFAEQRRRQMEFAIKLIF